VIELSLLGTFWSEINRVRFKNPAPVDDLSICIIVSVDRDNKTQNVEVFLALYFGINYKLQTSISKIQTAQI